MDEHTLRVRSAITNKHNHVNTRGDAGSRLASSWNLRLQRPNYGTTSTGGKEETNGKNGTATTTTATTTVI